MNPTQRQRAQWQRVKPIFHEALALPERERAAYLQQACTGDEALLREVQALLDSAEETGEFLQQPAIANVRLNSLLKDETDLSSGQRIGPYEIQTKIGEGGMGQVYRARDARLGRAVAIKVLRADLTREADRLRRFRQEARAAPALNHPNILTIYEVDREDELDYIATEFIEGQRCAPSSK
jgi:predicted unusual protein kinase regulating ubiquinone biosynthesis (AarF/ABC1/UbiB family)